MDPILDSAYFTALPLIAFEFEAIVEILVGTGMAFLGLIEVLTVSIPDIFDTIYTLATWVITHMACFTKIINNWTTCIPAYGVEAFGQLLYLPIRLTFAALYLIGLDVYPVETFIWDIIYKIDCFIYDYIIEFHISHFPEFVIDRCYNCCRVKTQAVMNKGGNVMRGINERAPDLLYPGINLMAEGGTKFMNPFG